MNDSELITWAETYKPEVNDLRINDSTCIQDLNKCLDSYVHTLNATKGKPIYIPYRDQLLQIRRLIEEKEIVLQD